METPSSQTGKCDRLKRGLPFYVAALAICSALILGIASWMHLCSHECIANHSYRLFGFTFESVGVLFFSLIVMTHLFSKKMPALGFLASWLLCAALGAEIVFLYTQKYKIGTWCPLCLGIAASLGIASVAYFFEFYQNLNQSLEKRERRLIMDSICKGCAAAIFFSLGFIFAFFGISKENTLHAAEATVKQNIVFGNQSSPVEIYIFTDWNCLACRNLEPVFEATTRNLMGQAKITFVDFAVHPDSLNFTPYNLSFMIHNKPHYFALRRALGALGQRTRAPTDQQVAALAAQQGARYMQLNYADVALGIKYFNHLVRQHHVYGTPSIVIVNQKTRKQKKLEGEDDITLPRIMASINSVR